MTHAEAIRYPTSRKVLLATARARKRFVAWTNDGTYTNTWRVSTALRVAAVYQGTSAMAAASSESNCNSTDLSWYWAESTSRLYINPSSTTNPNTLVIVAEVEVGVGTFGKTPRGIGADKVYYARLLGLPSVSLRVPDRFGEVGQIGTGNLVIANGDGWAEDLGDLDWDGGTVTLKHGIDVF